MQGQGMYYTPTPLVFNENQSHASYLVPSAGLPATVHFPPTSVSQNVYSTSSLSSATAVNGANTTFSWAHTVPTYMPWAVQRERGPVMRFMAPMAPDPCTSQTASTWELLHNLGTTCTRSSHGINQHLKRRSDTLEDELRPSKQYISEEKMAASMNQLHISSSYAATQQQRDQRKTVTIDLDESEESDTDDSPTLKGSIQFSPELKKLMEPNPVIVKALMKDIEKPSMALVLWQPPGGIIPEKIQQATESSGHLQESSLQTSSSHTSVPTTNSVMVPAFQEHNNNNSTMLNLNTLDGTSRYTRSILDDSSVDMDDMEL